MPRKTARAQRDRIIDAALDLAAAEGWRSIMLSRIAEAAGVDLAALHAEFPVKASILDGFLRRIEAQVLAGGPVDADDSPRDRLFEILMRRYDAMAPYKAAVAAILHDAIDPWTLMVGVPALARSMTWMLEAAGISSSGLIGLARTKGLVLVCFETTRVWVNDDTEDLSRTMAALDKALRPRRVDPGHPARAAPPATARPPSRAEPCRTRSRHRYPIRTVTGNRRMAANRMARFGMALICIAAASCTTMAAKNSACPQKPGRVRRPALGSNRMP